MTDDLRPLLRRASDGLPSRPDLADLAWTTARRRVRRDRAVAVAAAVGVCVLAAGLLGANPWDDRATPPAPADTPPPRGEDAWDVPEFRAIVQQPWRESRALDLESIDNTFATNENAALSVAGMLLLSEDPVESAVAAVTLRREEGDVRVLGVDGVWRQVDVPFTTRSYQGTPFPLIGDRSLSPDGTQLAVFQPGRIVVVDLTTGTTRDLPVDDFLPLERWAETPRWPVVQWTPDGSQLLLGYSSYAPHTRPSMLIDVDSGAVTPVPYDVTQTGFLGDGSAVTVGGLSCLCELIRYDGSELVASSTMLIEAYRRAPAGAEVVAVHREGATAADDPAASSGLLVADPASGEALAFLPVPGRFTAELTQLVGWLDDETLVFRVPPTHSGWSHLLAWNYATGEIKALDRGHIPLEIEVLSLALDQLQ